ncbi:hypothetical protein [Azospirillum agricola]|uniref:hypothetical protein n=1 Tax=Azospirillum agricola TaxID=1720247 RepID=UPI000A0F28D2|nr:hypothetical protein [Azospirillum agricola]SMH52359.1 hypothetical protein SAMN02982994_3112 [Azospirillum lipoferum]
MSGCGGGACGGGGGRSGGGSGPSDYRRILRTGLMVNALLGFVLLSAGTETRAVALWAVALLFLNRAATHGVGLWTAGEPMARRPMAPVPGRSLEARAGLSLLRGLLLGAGVAWVIVAAGRRLIDGGLLGDGVLVVGGVPEAPLAGLALLLAGGVTLAMATLLFAGRRGRPTPRSVWLCSRADLLPLGAALLGVAGVAVLGQGWPDAAVAALVAATLLPDAWAAARTGAASLAAGPGAARPR